MTQRRITPVLVALSLLGFVGAASAQAASVRSLPMTEVGRDSASPVFADGRWVALPSTLTVPGGARDDATGQVVAYPTALCPPALETGLRPAGGVSFLRCNGLQQSIFDLASGQLVPVPLQPGQALAGSVGSQWLLVVGESNDAAYVNWHTGEQRPARFLSGGQETLDPDTQDLRPLLTLVRRTTLLGSPSRRLVTFAQPRVRSLSLRTGGHTISLARHCGAAGCRSVQYVAGVVTWSQGPSVHTYVVRSKRHYQWTPNATQQHLLAYSPTIGRIATVTHTANHVYATWLRSSASLAPGERKDFISFQAALPTG